MQVARRTFTPDWTPANLSTASWLFDIWTRKTSRVSGSEALQPCRWEDGNEARPLCRFHPPDSARVIARSSNCIESVMVLEAHLEIPQSSCALQRNFINFNEAHKVHGGHLAEITAFERWEHTCVRFGWRMCQDADISAARDWKNPARWPSDRRRLEDRPCSCQWERAHTGKPFGAFAAAIKKWKMYLNSSIDNSLPPNPS